MSPSETKSTQEHHILRGGLDLAGTTTKTPARTQTTGIPITTLSRTKTPTSHIRLLTVSTHQALTESSYTSSLAARNSLPTSRTTTPRSRSESRTTPGTTLLRQPSYTIPARRRPGIRRSRLTSTSLLGQRMALCPSPSQRLKHRRKQPSLQSTRQSKPRSSATRNHKSSLNVHRRRRTRNRTAGSFCDGEPRTAKLRHARI